MGVVFKKDNISTPKVYYVQCRRVNTTSRYIGRYHTPKEAHQAWQLAKAGILEDSVLKYMLEPCYRQDVANALYMRVEMLRNDADAGRETKVI